MVSPYTKFDGVAQRSFSDHFDLRTVAESHLQKAATNLRIPAHGNDRSLATLAKLVEAACFRAAGVIAIGIVARFVHITLYNWDYNLLRLSFN
jgi:hypothetical protein